MKKKNKTTEVAEAQVVYTAYVPMDLKSIIATIAAYFKNDSRVKAAWLFGSLVRGDQNHKSDIDLMVRFNETVPISLFDFADIVYLLEQKTKRKIDLVEEGCLKPFALETAQKELLKIYG